MDAMTKQATMERVQSPRSPARRRPDATALLGLTDTDRTMLRTTALPPVRCFPFAIIAATSYALPVAYTTVTYPSSTHQIRFGGVHAESDSKSVPEQAELRIARTNGVVRTLPLSSPRSC